VLPHSGLVVGYSALYWQYSDPRDTRPWVPPTLAAELTSQDYASNRDPALDVILNYKPRPPLEETIVDLTLKQNVEAAIKQYREFKADRVNAYSNIQWSLRLAGRRLMNAHKRSADAIEIFKLNVSEYPRSDEAHYLLGDAYERAGNKELAIKCYEAAVKVNPRNWEAADGLRNLAGRRE
jgi:tetratricopeptide (TPR) repeat protein